MISRLTQRIVGAFRKPHIPNDQFHVGQWVRCVSSHESGTLTKGHVYRVVKLEQDWYCDGVRLFVVVRNNFGQLGSFFATRFVSIT